MAAITPTQSNVQQALGNFLLAVLPLTAVQIIVAQQNRTAEPAATTFVVMTPLRLERLATNIDGYGDVEFTGSVAATAMTVTAVEIGALTPGAPVFGPGVAAGTTIVSQTSGTPGGAGVYVVSVAQTISSQVMGAGQSAVTQNAEVTFQLDFHSADTTAGDMAQTVSTLLRDEFGVDFFAGQAPPLNGVVPLYADDPRQMPFLNAEQQYEWRWVLEVKLQVEQVVTIPAKYADEATVKVVDVNALP